MPELLGVVAVLTAHQLLLRDRPRRPGYEWRFNHCCHGLTLAAAGGLACDLSHRAVFATGARQSVALSGLSWPMFEPGAHAPGSTLLPLMRLISQQRALVG